MTQIILTVIFVQLLENWVYFEIFFCLQEKKTRVTLIQNFMATSQKKKSHFKAYSAQMNG